jgi:hypothetical protein
MSSATLAGVGAPFAQGSVYAIVASDSQKSNTVVV